MSLIKPFEGRLVFKCRKCGLERYGSEDKNCEHLYQDYAAVGYKDAETNKIIYDREKISILSPQIL